MYPMRYTAIYYFGSGTDHVLGSSWIFLEEKNTHCIIILNTCHELIYHSFFRLKKIINNFNSIFLLRKNVRSTDQEKMN